ncbi:N-acetylmuramoyl-L-alanine amidase, partial [Candidatus Pacearchaeota archaeon]|nr:N-acetylmuramoyl-L-alanine amidase [Candidatus Pacearchaeota archaeon]
IKSDYYLDSMNGAIEIGRPIDGDMIVESEEKGAHAYGYNSDSIGVCLVGKERFSPAQLSTLFDLVSDLMVKFEIGPENVVGHYELDPRKSCPNIDMDAFRKLLKKVMP